MNWIIPLLICFTFSASAQWVRTSLVSTAHIEAFLIKDSALFVATYGDGVYQSTNNGDTWTARSTGLTNRTITSLALSDTLLFAGAWPGGIYRSTNNGIIWLGASSGLTSSKIQSVLSYEDSTPGSNILIAGSFDGGIFRSTNNGGLWHVQNAGLSSLAVNVLERFDALVFAGTDSGAFISADTGLTWSPAGLSAKSISSFTRRGTNIIAGCAGDSGGIFSTSDFGTSWTGIDANLPAKNVWSVLAKNGILFVGTVGGGVYNSTDGGSSWLDVSAGLTTSNVQSLIVAPDGLSLFAGTDHDGVWRRPLSEVITGFDLTVEPSPSPTLLSNYPNPFNPVTTIRYELANRVAVRLDIYDVLGRLVKTLIEETQPAGLKEIEWNASDAPSGVYYCRLQAGTNFRIRKIVIVR